MVEQLICNQQVGGSSPFAGSSWFAEFLLHLVCFGDSPVLGSGTDRCGSLTQRLPAVSDGLSKKIDFPLGPFPRRGVLTLNMEAGSPRY